ncbi:MAG: BBE domain-containing protein [Acetatifactor sp.]
MNTFYGAKHQKIKEIKQKLDKKNVFCYDTR